MSKASQKIVAEICLYGNGAFGCGAGWLARTETRLLGDGVPVAGRTYTQAVFAACDALRLCMEVPASALVRIYEAGGELFADALLANPGWFGDLQWRPVTPIEISAEAIEAAAHG